MAVEQYLGWVDYLAISLVLLISSGIGVFFAFSGGKQSTANEFLLASRSMPAFPVIFSLVVTFISPIAMLGVPAEVYNFGLYRIIAYAMSTFGNVCSAYLFLPVYFQMGTAVSVYEYLERRFGKIARNMASILFIIQTVSFIAVVLYAPALALNAVITSLPIPVTVIVIGVVCTFYCTLGGLKAVLWTDVFQAIIMYITVFAILGVGIVSAGGLSQVFSRAYEGGRLAIWNPSASLTDRYTLWNCLTFGFIIGLGNYGCNQAQVQRMLSVKNLQQSQKSVLLSVPLAIIFISVSFLIGLVLFANFHDCDPFSDPETKLYKADQLVPHFIIKDLSKFRGLAGICIAGIFSGSLSTVSSAVNSLSAVTMEDFIRPYCTKGKLSEKSSAILVKALTIGYGLIGISLTFAVAQIKGILKAHTMLFSTVAGPVLGLFTLGMMTVSTNEMGAVTGLVSGFVAAIGLVINSLAVSSENAILGRSVEGCPRTGNGTIVDQMYSLNQTYTYNESNSDDMQFSSSMATFDDGNRTFLSNHTMAPPAGNAPGDIAFMWFITVGFVVTVFVGYLVSFLTDHRGMREIDPVLISPPLRKWLITPLPQGVEEEGRETSKL